MSLTFYGFTISQPARAVEWALLAEGTAHERRDVMPGVGTRTKEFRKEAMHLTVPRINDGGFVLNESHAIMTYLGDKHSWALYPRDPETRAKIQEYFNWHHQNTRLITLAFFAPLVRTDIKQDPGYVRISAERATAALKFLEQLLGKHDWVARTSVPTVADLSCFCEVSQCLPDFFDIHDISGYPNILAWVRRCKALPGYEAAHAPLFKRRNGMMRLLAKSKAQSKL